MSIPAEAFEALIKELERRPLCVNKYRLVSGAGKSQTFGVVNRRSLAPDYSRQNWLRPYLYKLLLDFAAKYVSIPYTSITLNQNYKAKPHKDKGNIGNSFLVSFGNFTGGNLKIYGGEVGTSLSTSVDVRTPLITDFSKVFHEVEEFQGDRYSLVFYTLDKKHYKDAPELPPPSVVKIGNKFFFKRGDVVIRDGLPHPLKGRVGGIVRDNTPTEVSFF